MLKKVISQYVVYVIYFLGIGMTSSGIVLMPFNTVRYSIILAIGLLLFSTGSFINEYVIDKKKASMKRILKLVLVSLTLAIGIGMISGGISHFKESPIYASYLIPLGVVISVTSFVIKNAFVLTRVEIRTLALWVIVVGIMLYASLAWGADYYLASVSGQEGGDIFMNMN